MTSVSITNNTKTKKQLERNSINEVRNSQVTKSSYETEIRKMTSHVELLTEYDVANMKLRNEKSHLNITVWMSVKP